MTWKAKITRISDLNSGQAQVDTLFYDEGTENQFTKSFQIDFMAFSDQEQILNIIRSHRDSLNALDAALTELSGLVDQEIE